MHVQKPPRPPPIMPLFLVLIFLSLSQPRLSIAATTNHARRCTTVTSTRTYKKCMPLQTQQASIAWTYHPRNSTLNLAFFGSFLSRSGWVSWGINPVAAQMTGTRALIAFFDPGSGGLVVLPFLLNSSVKYQTTALTSHPLDIPLPSSSVVFHRGAGSAVAGATVEIHASFKLPRNKTTIHHVWNRGLYVQGYSPTIHPTTPADLASRATFDVVSSAATEPRTPPALSVSLKPAHAILNSISWGFLLPVGVATARYLRGCESMGPSWFYAHAGIQILGFLLGAAGFVTGLILGGPSPEVTHKLHRGLGVAVICAGSLQMLALLFHPSVTHKFRKYWKSYHHFFGYGCAVVGVVNVFQGFEVMGIGGTHTVMGYCLVLSTLFGVCIALEANSWVVFCRNNEMEEIKQEEETTVEGSSGGEWRPM